MEKLNELVEQAKFVADWHGSDWSSALCQGKDGKQTHEIICESRGETVISTGSNSNDASWLCDYLELCSPANILAIAEAFRALQKQRDALAAENAGIKASIEMHAAGFKICPACSHQDECETDDVVWMVREATAATDAYLNSVRAEGVRLFAAAVQGGCAVGDRVKDLADTFAAQLRAGKDGE